MIKLVDQWTTQDGEWHPNSKTWGISSQALHQYNSEPIPGKGAATHIFVKGRVGDVVEFRTDAGLSVDYPIVHPSGWVNHYMERGSAYYGDEGPWHVYVNGVKVSTKGIGLPGGHHVSTFLITEDVEGSVEPTPQPEPPVAAGQYIEVVVRTMLDGLQIGEQVVWRSQ